MGFWGQLVFARSDSPLREAPVFAHLEDDAETWEEREGGWQLLALHRAEWDEDFLPSLVEWSGAPALVAQVADSDTAFVRGLDGEGRTWETWLNPDQAAGLLIERPEDIEDDLDWLESPEFPAALARERAELDAEIPEAARAAAAWATTAGVPTPPQTAPIEQLLRAKEDFAEEHLPTLLDRLGFPE
ncbi:hypothetical protein [Streptomyces sp. NPDC088923]|uniref:hypothetical protein n=1 Tax=Streptomyces sp. NPDC088923 TaxID=3365913 RepID=UPI003824CB92